MMIGIRQVAIAIKGKRPGVDLRHAHLEDRTTVYDMVGKTKRGTVAGMDKRIGTTKVLEKATAGC